MNNTNDEMKRKQDLDLTILKAHAEQLRREVSALPGYSGMKYSLSLISQSLSSPDVSESALETARARLIVLERNLRERQAKELLEKENTDTQFDRIGKSMTGELQL